MLHQRENKKIFGEHSIIVSFAKEIQYLNVH